MSDFDPQNIDHLTSDFCSVINNTAPAKIDDPILLNALDRVFTRTEKGSTLYNYAEFIKAMVERMKPIIVAESELTWEIK